MGPELPHSYFLHPLLMSCSTIYRGLKRLLNLEATQVQRYNVGEIRRITQRIETSGCYDLYANNPIILYSVSSVRKTTKAVGIASMESCKYLASNWGKETAANTELTLERSRRRTRTSTDVVEVADARTAFRPHEARSVEEASENQPVRPNPRQSRGVYNSEIPLLRDFR